MGLPYPKQLLPFAGTTVLQHAIGLFKDLPVYTPVPVSFKPLFQEKIGDQATIIDGGDTRFQSVKNAFLALPNPADDDLIIIHDAARPFFDPADLDQAMDLAQQRGAVIYAAPATDTIKQVGQNAVITATLDRDRIYHAQTPQIFKAGILRKAYAAFSHDQTPTDEARLVELAGFQVSVFPGSHRNRKLTHKEDLQLIQQNAPRIGHGYDVHRFDPDRPLFLGGVQIPEGPGLLGHSDADVALHALIDAMLGAAGMGDIGHWFPDDDPSLKGIRSTLLLERVANDLSAKGFTFINGDITIQAQAPKLAPHIPAMRETIAAILNTTRDRINVKATTTEKLGFVGRKEGIAADAVVLLARE